MFFNLSLSSSNYILAAIHAIAALCLLVFAIIRRNRSFDYELYFRDKTFNIKSIWIVYGAVAFLGITSLVHVFYGWDYDKMYSSRVNKMKQYFRWIEYGITATLMSIIIALISGVKNVYTLILLGTLISSVMVTGYWFESIYVSGSLLSYKYLVPLILGFFMITAYIFVVFMTYLDEKKKYEAKENKTLPRWITFSVIGTLLFFSSFGVVPLLKLFSYKLNDMGIKFKFTNTTYEYCYLILSLTAKLYLGFFLGYGLLQRTE